MAHLIGAQNLLSLAGSRILLANITVGIDDGTRLGILGPNGAGKSTLMRLLSGKQAPDEGLLTRTDGVSVAMLDQADTLDPALTVVETVHPNQAEHEWASDSAVRQIHAGLLNDLDLSAKVGELSGGQKRRVALAAQLTKQADVLFLDEPTNHLDVEGVDWLITYLKERYPLSGPHAKGALVVVTHDRWFLDEICTRVWEVVPGVDPGYGRPQIPGRIEQYEGSYAAYVLARAERARQAATAASKRENLLRKELAWLRRGAPARTSKPRYRIDAAEALIADVPPPRDQVELVKMATARLGKDVIDLEDVSFSYGQGADAPSAPAETGTKALFDHVTWRLAPAERVGIVGVNGAGKTTLLRLMQKQLEPTQGRIKHGKTVQIAVLSQSTHELDEVSHLRVVEAVNEVAPIIQVGDKEITASQMVERMGFTKERAWTRVAELSGGERRRLQLMRLLMGEPNVLMLDEPTNDLDTDTLAAMEDLLDSFPGTLIVVSHDRYLLERITDHQVALYGDGKVVDLPGGVDQYLQRRRADLKAGLSEGIAEGDSGAGTLVKDKARISSSAQQRLAQKAVARIDRSMDKVQKQIDKLHAAMEKASAAIVENPEKVDELTQLSKDLKAAEEQLEQLELEWLEASEGLE
ncbi:ABC-F family ATP-binding cassette domain-containing protein [Boudabousia marimammalium]|uniref:Glycerophosphodiester phosphodiesterase n=1 Tax=Boudabousia marimammalium TaxID=156892 RepID=A0A1Q5PRS9_9ACTO|nr:ABC-F family ATP-binding cassette domain-containing protein [Boudabousia marimammalium]OKL50294.1 glycerophosphodiester phosphodiesterase [Boudabousia marimammalium]